MQELGAPWPPAVGPHRLLPLSYRRLGQVPCRRPAFCSQLCGTPLQVSDLQTQESQHCAGPAIEVGGQVGQVPISQGGRSQACSSSAAGIS